MATTRTPAENLKHNASKVAKQAGKATLTGATYAGKLSLTAVGKTMSWLGKTKKSYDDNVAEKAFYERKLREEKEDEELRCAGEKTKTDLYLEKKNMPLMESLRKSATSAAATTSKAVVSGAKVAQKTATQAMNDFNGTSTKKETKLEIEHPTGEPDKITFGEIYDDLAPSYLDLSK